MKLYTKQQLWLVSLVSAIGAGVVVDPAVLLGELLAQSDFRLYRRVRVSLKPRREVGAKRG